MLIYNETAAVYLDSGRVYGKVVNSQLDWETVEIRHAPLFTLFLGMHSCCFRRRHDSEALLILDHAALANYQWKKVITLLGHETIVKGKKLLLFNHVSPAQHNILRAQFSPDIHIFLF